MKRILILGGTSFIGRTIVNRLTAIPQFDLTLFNRQQTNVELFPNVKRLKGDRESDDIQAIGQHEYDLVIDISCYFPSSLQTVLEHLKIEPESYIFISTCSVYENSDLGLIRRDENASILSCTPEQAISRDDSTYGQRKAECERTLKQSGLNHVIFRPALVFGPYDPTDRFYFWLYQVERNAILLLPEGGKRRFSITYVHDLADLVVKSLSMKLGSGVYNAISKPEVSIGEIVETASKLLDKHPVSIDARYDFLQGQKIREWSDMPLWIHGDHFTYSNTKAKSELNFAPTSLSNAMSTTIEYYSKLDWPPPKFGMSEKRRLELITELS